MSALRKQEPFSTTTDEIEEANIDPAIRRPPQSVATPVTENTNDRAIDETGDTYEGEIVTSTIDDTPPAFPQPGASPRYSQKPAPRTASQAGREDTHLFDEEELRDFRARWDQVQTSFVDEPHHAVEQADALVATVVKRIADQFSEERAKLEKQRGRDHNASTEDLRQNFRRYRAFFDRLLGF